MSGCVPWACGPTGGFFKWPLEILDCRRGGADLPESDDIDGWRVLFTDARDYAISEIDQAIENGVDELAESYPENFDGDQPALIETDEPADAHYQSE